MPSIPEISLTELRILFDMSTARSPRRGIAVVAGAWGNRDLRRLTLAWGAFFLIDSITLVSVSVWAFDQGGASAVGLIGVCSVVARRTGPPVRRMGCGSIPRRRVVGTVFAAELLALLALSAAIGSRCTARSRRLPGRRRQRGPDPIRPAHLALVPLVSRSAEELVAANVTGGAVDGLATLAGPVLAAVLLIAGGPPIATASAAVAAALGLVAVLGVRPASDPRQPPASFPNRRWQRCRAAFVFCGASAIRRWWWAVS